MKRDPDPIELFLIMSLSLRSKEGGNQLSNLKITNVFFHNCC